MDYSAFGKTEAESYRAEACERWGDTQAYREYERRSEAETRGREELLMAYFRSLGALRSCPPESEAVQRAVDALKDCITENYYTCTEEILSGLGEMYAADPRFRKNIDAAGGEGTAEFVREAIRRRSKR